MKFKKITITNFALKTLENYIIDLEFKDEIGSVKINALAKLSNNFVEKEFFDQVPELILLPKPGASFQLGIGPLTFNDSKTKNQLQIGDNYLKIIIKKYENWATEYEKIKGIFMLLSEIISEITIKRFQITCTNKFDKIKQEEKLPLENYFTHFVKSEFPMNYKDFHLGFVPHWTEGEGGIEKIVLKLRGNPPKTSEFFLFNLESLYIKRNLDVKLSDSKLLKDINHGHDFLNYLFVESLNEKYREAIGLKFDPPDEI